jgi:hypothetical protein
LMYADSLVRLGQPQPARQVFMEVEAALATLRGPIADVLSLRWANRCYPFSCAGNPQSANGLCVVRVPSISMLLIFRRNVMNFFALASKCGSTLRPLHDPCQECCKLLSARALRIARGHTRWASPSTLLGIGMRRRSWRSCQLTRPLTMLGSFRA